MLRVILLAGVLVALVAAPMPSYADAPEPTEKCDNLQDRCLHHEGGICVIWHDECLVKKPVGHGAKIQRHRYGARRNKV